MKKVINAVTGKGNRVSTVVGTIVGGAVVAAAKQFATTGNLTSWQPYAMAGVGGAIAAGGALWESRKNQ